MRTEVAFGTRGIVADMRFDVILTNPPFQDRVRRGKTPHKLWIAFTRTLFDRLLKDGGLLCQVSPSSFQSPSNKVLALMRNNTTEWVDFDIDQFFPDIGSTFACYAIRKQPRGNRKTLIIGRGKRFSVGLDEHLFYLPNNLCREALEVHRKVMFDTPAKMLVEHDYVTCHNIILRTGSTLSRERTDVHIHPTFHTNRQIWWSSVEQAFSREPKVMWTRSGYTKPFFDPGELGGTDLVYFVRVASAQQGTTLAHNMNLQLMRYIFMTAKWSGFGNERVFAALPVLPLNKKLTDSELYSRFELTEAEVRHVEEHLG
jgi:hypothetical protein